MSEGEAMKRISVRARALIVVSAMLMGLGTVATPASAVVIGPDSWGYTAETDLTGFGFFQDLSLFGTPILENVDDVAVAVDLPFPFPFYDETYTQVFVSSNGILTFEAPNATQANANLTNNVGFTQPVIAPLWDDWITSCGDLDEVHYVTFGNRLMVQWTQASRFNTCGPDTVTFQAILGPDGTIVFTYPDVSVSVAAASNGGSATVGIRDDAGPGGALAPANGRFLQVSLNTPTIDDGEVICIQPPNAQISCASLLVLGGGGGGDPEPRRNRFRTRLTIDGPQQASPGDTFWITGALRSRRAGCESGMEIEVYRENRLIGRAVTGDDGRYRIRATLVGSRLTQFHSEFDGARVGSGRCRPAISNPVEVGANT